MTSIQHCYFCGATLNGRKCPNQKDGSHNDNFCNACGSGKLEQTQGLPGVPGTKSIKICLDCANKPKASP